MKETFLFLFLLSALAGFAQSAQSAQSAQVDSLRGMMVNVKGQGTQEETGKIYAVIVGVSEYNDKEMPQLNYADDDAQSFYSFLTTAYKNKIDTSNIHLLLNKEAKNFKIWEQLSNVMAEKLNAGDRVYFYFSGHGDAANAEDFYLLTHETKKVNDPSLYNPITSFGIAGFAPKIKEITDRGVKFYLIVDACRTNQGNVTASGLNYYPDRLKEITKAVQMFGCQPNQQSKEGSGYGGGRGVFSFCLLNGMTGEADRNGNGDITFTELRSYVGFCVEDSTKSLYTGIALQSPEMTGMPDEVMIKVDKKLSEQLLAMNTSGSAKGDETLKGLNDHITDKELYAKYNEALAEGRLIEPAGNNADFYLSKLLNEINDAVTKEQLINSMLAALLDKGQAPINYYAEGLLDSIKFNYDYFMDASKYFEAALKYLGRNPELFKTANASRLFLQARAMVESSKEQDWERGLLMADSALALNSWAYIYHTKGLLLGNLKMYKEEIEVERTAIKLSPKWVLPYNAMGTTFEDLRQTDSAIWYYRKAIEVNPKYETVYNNLGNIFKDGVELPDSAVRYYRKAIELNPQNAVVCNNLGNVFSNDLSEPDSALRYYRKAIELNPKYGDALFNLGNIFKDYFEQTDSAIWYYQKAVGLNPELRKDAKKNTSHEFSLLPNTVISGSTGHLESLSEYLKNTGTSYHWFKQQQFFTATPSVLRRGKVEIDNMDLKITYKSSLSNAAGLFGYGWSCNYESYMDISRSTLSKIIYHDESGKEIIFEPASSSRFDSLFIDGEIRILKNMPLQKIMDSFPVQFRTLFEKLRSMMYAGNSENVLMLNITARGFAMRTGTSEYNFTKRGRLNSIIIPGKRPVHIHYDNHGHISVVSDGLRYVLVTHNESDLVSSVRYEDSTEYYFTYASGQLRSVKSNVSKQEYFYFYNGINLIERIFSLPDSNQMFIGYDTERRKIYVNDTGYAYTRWDYTDNDSVSSVTRVAVTLNETQEFSSDKYETDSLIYDYDKKTNLLRRYNAKSGYFNLFSVTPCACLPLMVISGTITSGNNYDDDYDYYDKETTESDSASGLLSGTAQISNDSLRIPEMVQGDTAATLTQDTAEVNLPIIVYNDTSYYYYDDYGNCTEVNTKYSHIVLHAGAPCNKIDTVREFGKKYSWETEEEDDSTASSETGEKLKSLIVYAYDKNCNLEWATDVFSNERMKITYDDESKITGISRFDKSDSTHSKIEHTLYFKYNANGKPNEIILDSFGYITTTYDSLGEIDNVKSSFFNEAVAEDDEDDAEKPKKKKKKNKKEDEAEDDESTPTRSLRSIASEISTILTEFSSVIKHASPSVSTIYTDISNYKTRLTNDDE